MVQEQATEPADGSAPAARIDWDAVLRSHGRWLRTILYSRLQDAEAVEEAMQELALAAVRETAPPADRTRLGPWLYRVAIRQALLYRRKCGRRRNLTARYADRHPPTDQDRSAPDPLEWLLAEERRRLVRVALARLPRRDAEILLLKYTEDWSYQQIAAHLGTTTDAVESRLHRARQRLRAELAKSEGGTSDDDGG
jgi:RNA polymerase sigma-70 factor (ECF subfamily)